VSVAAEKAEKTVEQGLTHREAAETLQRVGPNILVPERRQSALLWVARLFADPMVLLLLVAGGTYVILGDVFDASVALGALLPIFLVTSVLEYRSDRALAELRRLASPTGRVVRDGVEIEIDARAIVPGDAMLVREGDVFLADGALVDGTVVVDESALTGESLPVTKTALGESIYAGTALRSGRAMVRVTATGARTKYGRIGTLMSGMRVGSAPIERAIHRLVWQAGSAVIVLCVIVIFMERSHGSLWPAAIIAGVSLAMAAIPEELPMVYTLYLALGAWRLAKENALVRRLPSVEALGAVSAICVDKTGTLTLGTVEISAIWPVRNAQTAELLRAAVLACDPDPFDPMDVAVFRFARSQIADAVPSRDDLLERYSFDPRHRRVTNVWRDKSFLYVATKGAVENILELCDVAPEERHAILDNAQRYAQDGMRVLAVAALARNAAASSRDEAESGLRILGLLVFSDPLRDGVAESIEECYRAGISVIMITGDHPATARAIARHLALRSDGALTGSDLERMSDAQLITGLSSTRIFARIQPEQKLRIVKALRARGDVVAVTGDGTNDALALREADIGVAMGKRGTEVARSAADLVLLDDNFATIVGAIAGGRRIFRNLRRAFRYLNGFHAPLIISAVAIPFFGVPLLLLPIHLVWLELIVHPTSALVYENDPGSVRELLSEPPRKRGAPILRSTDWIRPLLLGCALTVGCLAVYLFDLGHGYSAETARGMGLATLLVGQMLLVLTERSTRLPIWRQPFKNNVAIAPILLGSILMMIVMLYVHPLANVFSIAAPTPVHLLESVAVAAVCVLWLEPFKMASRGSSL
jgi:Ca2+-transporting ATPase